MHLFPNFSEKEMEYNFQNGSCKNLRAMGRSRSNSILRIIIETKRTWKSGNPTMWPNLSQMKPEPVPSTFAFSSSNAAIWAEFLGTLVNSRSLMKTTEGEISYNHRSQLMFRQEFEKTTWRNLTSNWDNLHFLQPK